MLSKFSAPPFQFVLLPFIFFVGVPLLFIKENIGEIVRLDSTLFPILFGLWVIAVGVLLSIEAVFRRLHLSYFRYFIEFACVFILLTGFIFPLAQSSGMVDPDEVPFNALNLVYSLLISGTVFVPVFRKFRPTLYIGLLFFVGLNSLLAVYVITAESGADREHQSLYKVASEGNLFVLSLDGVSGSAAMEILQEDKQLAQMFKGFTIFKNAASSSPATAASTAASLYGNQDFKSRYKFLKQVWESNPEQSFVNVADSAGYRVSTFGHYNTTFKKENRQHSSSAVRGVEASEVLRYSTARLISSELVSSGVWLEALENRLQSVLPNSLKNNKNNLIEKTELSNAKKWKKKLAVTILDLNAYISGLKISGSEPAAHFLHYTFTHFPVEFDRNCKFMGHDPQWFASNQNRSGVKEETRCTLRKYGEFVARLKELGIFDTSLVVLKSDHGKPTSYNRGKPAPELGNKRVAYYDSTSIFSKRIADNPMWGYGRYEPFLAIKNFGAVADTPFKVNKLPVLLDDLALTLCLAAEIGERCAGYPGFDLLNPNLEIPEDAYIFMNVVSSKKSSHMYITHRGIRVKRQPNIHENLYKALSEEVQ